MNYRKKQKDYIMTIKKLETICFEFLIGSCNIKYFFDELPNFKLSMYFKQMNFQLLASTGEHVFLLCKYLNQEYKSKMKKFCDWCLFYKNLMTFCGEFNDLRQRSDTFNIEDVFDLYFRILNYWCTVNKKIFDNFFDFFTY